MLLCFYVVKKKIEPKAIPTSAIFYYKNNFGHATFVIVKAYNYKR